MSRLARCFRLCLVVAATLGVERGDAAEIDGLNFHVISFSVGDDRYHEAKERLRQSCEQHGIKHSLDRFEVHRGDSSKFDVSSVMESMQEVLSYGPNPVSAENWALQYTYSFKPIYILYKLLTLKGPVLWMDSDLQFEKVPELLRQKAGRPPIDLGVVNNKPFWKHTIWDGYSMYASSGVIFFNYTRPTLEVVEEWIRHVNFGSNVAAADDKQLDEVYNARWATKLEEKHMNVAWLPRSYLQFYSAQSNTVILHPGALSVKPRQISVKKPPANFFVDLPSPFILSVVASIERSAQGSRQLEAAVDLDAGDGGEEEIDVGMDDLQEDWEWEIPESIDL